MKTIKKILCSLLVAVICLTSAPLEDFIEFEWPELLDINFSVWFSSDARATKSIVDSGSCGGDGDNVKWYLYSDGELNITGFGNMVDISSSTGSPWYNKSELVSLIKIDDGITNIGDYAFSNLHNVESVIIPNSVKVLGVAAFFNCWKLKTLTISEGIIEIKRGAFEQCYQLEKIYLPKSLMSIGDEVFRGCSSLVSITVDADNEYYSSDEIGVLFDKNKNIIIKYPEGNPKTSYNIPYGVTQINKKAFWGSEYLRSILIPSSITSIGEAAFAHCGKIEEMLIPEGVLSIDSETFQYCYNLKSVTIPKSTTYIGSRAFEHCEMLNDIILPTEITYIGDSAFFDTAYYNDVNNWKNGALIIDDYLIKISSDVTTERYEIDNGIKCIASGAFKDCKSLKSIIIADSVMNFGGAFSNCGKLENITIPECVTSIDSYTFWFCNNLSSIVIPNSMIKIDEYAFDYCNKLSDVYFVGTEEQWEQINIKKQGNKYLINANIHYNYNPAGNEPTVPDTPSEPEPIKSIAILTTNKSFCIKPKESMWVAFGLMREDGLLEENWKKMALSVSDPTIVSLSEYKETEYGYSLEIKGIKEGSTNIVVTDTETGLNEIFKVTVCDDFVKTTSFSIENVHTFYPSIKFDEKVLTNIYDMNGLYVNNYKCVKTSDGYNVTFDVYNQRYYSGAIDIYDENGIWIGYEEINKFSDITSLWDTGEQIYYMVFGGSWLSYEHAMQSEKTSVSIKVPDGGYFTVSNNVGSSYGVFLINALDIIFDAAYVALDLITSDSVKTHALSDFKKSAAKSLSDRLIEARNESLKNEVKKKAQKVMLSTMQSEVKKITSNFISSEVQDRVSSTEQMNSALADLAENILDSYNINWKHLFQSATGITESLFVQFAGPAGIALKGCFAITKSTNKLQMATQMAHSTNKSFATFYSNIEDGYINPHGIYVADNGNVDVEAILQVFRIAKDDSITVLLDTVDPLAIHELYNICFVKDDKLVQPNGKVKVYIPVPENMKGDTCTVYRQEPDGSWKIMQAHKEGDYLVFETEHFSLYAVIGISNSIEINTLPNKLVYEPNENLDTSGLSIRMNDNIIKDGFVCSPSILSRIGKQEIVVNYMGLTTEYEVTVEVHKHIVDENGICEKCGTDVTKDCQCRCHASGIKKLFFNFILFFQKLFRKNAVCDCGVSHY